MPLQRWKARFSSSYNGFTICAKELSQCMDRPTRTHPVLRSDIVSDNRFGRNVAQLHRKLLLNAKELLRYLAAIEAENRQR